MRTRILIENGHNFTGGWTFNYQESQKGGAGT